MSYFKNDKVIFKGKSQEVGNFFIHHGVIYTVSDNAGYKHIKLEGFGDEAFHISHFKPADKKVDSSDSKKFHSSHYESDSIEPIEYMMSNKMDFCRASIVKYTYRAGKKEGQEVLDIKKIIDYAMLLAIQEGIPFTKDDAQSIIDYRFNWKESRGKK